MLAFVLWAICVCAWGQIASSSLTGVVTSEEKAIEGGILTLRHETTGFTRNTRSTATGEYRVDRLSPGTYSVTLGRDGFRTVHVPGISLSVGQTGRLDFQLETGASTDSITVTAEVPPLESEGSAGGYRVEKTTITSLPLADRNILSLVTVGPGAIPRQLGGFVHDGITDVQVSRGAVALNPPIHGARTTMNIAVLDGMINTDQNAFAIAVTPPLSSVEEFRIHTHLAPAESPQGGGGVIDVVTRTGDQRFHGNAFELFRNEFMDARNYFDDPSLARPIYRRNQFGGALGGPLPFRRTVFFAAYEGNRGKTAKSSLNIVPDATLRSGDFRGQAAIFDPLNRLESGQRAAFPNNVVPGSRIDSIPRTFLDRFQPLPNRPAFTNNYLDATPSTNTSDLATGRIDHQFRDTSRLFGRYTLNEERGRSANSFPLLPAAQSTRAQQFGLGHTWTGATWLNEARVAFTRLRVFNLPENAFTNDVARELGINGVSDDPFTYGLPYFLVTNYQLRTDDPILPQAQRDNLWQISDSATLARGRHLMKAGFLFTRFSMAYQQSRLSRGQFVFTGALTAQLPVAGATGNAFADFLLAYPQVTNRNVGPTTAYLGRNTTSLYLQDEWRVLPSLTLTAGLRYEYGRLCEKRNSLLNLDYSTLPSPPALVRTSCPSEPDRNNFAPRIGLAWRVKGAVIRGGYGIYYNEEIAIETYDLIRNGVKNENNAIDGVTPLLTIRDGFPQTADTGFPSYFGLDRNARTPYTQQWSAVLGRELWGGIIGEVSYIGTKGTRLGRFRTFNTPLRVVTGENLGPRPGNQQQLRPFPSLGRIYQRQHISNSIYHGLELKAEKRFVNRLSFLASFVWSKSIDDADSSIPGQFLSFGAQDERNLRLERGLSAFHVGRRLSGAFAYRLPRMKGPRALLDGWQLTGIATIQDGTPLNPVYFAFDPANSGTPNRPNVVAGQSLQLPRSQRSVERFFNTDAFSTPDPFTFGNAGRNILPGPGNVVIDLALHKKFSIAEGHTLEFRAESFNIPNHPNWGIPGPYPDFGPFFGRIFATGDPRRVQLGVKFEF